MPSWLSNRFLFGVSVVVITGLMSFAFYLEYILELEPCPLCMAQRIVFVCLAVVFLVAFTHGPVRLGTVLYGILGLLVSGSGLALAGRQLWLQNLPDEKVPACGPSLEYMLEAFPLQEVVTIMLSGTGDCAEVQWVFLGLSIPGWTALAFSGFFLLWLFVIVRSILAKSQ